MCSIYLMYTYMSVSAVYFYVFSLLLCPNSYYAVLYQGRSNSQLICTLGTDKVVILQDFDFIKTLGFTGTQRNAVDV